MFTGLLDPATSMPRSRLFWVVLGGVIFAQLVALWMLCNKQVRLAQARQTEIQINQMAMADCLRYIPGATIATCKGGIMRADAPAAAVMGAAPTVTPVSFRR